MCKQTCDRIYPAAGFSVVSLIACLWLSHTCVVIVLEYVAVDWPLCIAVAAFGARINASIRTARAHQCGSLGSHRSCNTSNRATGERTSSYICSKCFSTLFPIAHPKKKHSYISPGYTCIHRANQCGSLASGGTRASAGRGTESHGSRGEKAHGCHAQRDHEGWQAW